MQEELNSVESEQFKRDATHLLGIGIFVTGGAVARPLLEEKLEEQAPDIIKNKPGRVLSSYLFLTVSGAILGGAVKAARTGTKDGAVAGMVVGGIAAFCGALLSDVASCVSSLRGMGK